MYVEMQRGLDILSKTKHSIEKNEKADAFASAERNWGAFPRRTSRSENGGEKVLEKPFQ